MRASASKLWLLERCQFFASPACPPHPPQEMGEPAQTGTALHSMVESMITGRAVHIPGGADKTRAMAMMQAFAEWWATFHRGLTWSSETAYAFDVETGAVRLLPSKSHRDYSDLRASEIPGTDDLSVIDGDEAIVVDLKTGRPENVDRADVNDQLRFLALCRSRISPVSRVRVVLAFVQPTHVWTDEATFDLFDLSDYEESLRKTARSISGWSPPQPGKPCSRCSAVSVCPGAQDAMALAAPEPFRLPIVSDPGKFQSPEHAAYQLRMLYALKAASAPAWAACRMYADGNDGIDVGNGKRWIKSVSEREKIDLEAVGAVAVLEETLGEHWRAAVSFETSKAGIKRAAEVVKAATGEPVARVVARAVDALREIGAVKTTTSTTYDEVTIKKDEAAEWAKE